MYRVIKRVGDIGISGVALIALAPLFVVVALAVRLESSGPAIFSQKRVGRNRKPFRIYKFRTMSKDTPADISAARRKKYGSDVAKVTKVGKILRVTSIDELPQLYNVLIGDMSLIGPRPVIPQEKKLTDERERLGALRVRPGMTGLAQVKGRNDIDYLQKAEYDAMYANNVTALKDFGIVVRSVLIVITRSGNQDAKRRQPKGAINVNN